VSDNPEYNNADTERIIAIDNFRKAIDACRTKLSQTMVQAELSYRYAIIRSYSKTLLRACEIYTLLREGYPEGSFALARSLHEAMIIIDSLLKGSSTNDQLLLQRFFDAANISQLQIDITSAKFVLEKGLDVQEASLLRDKSENELQRYKAKYPNVKNFRDYWWANASTFSSLANIGGFTNDYMYKHSSQNMHFNAYTVFNYLDKQEDSLLIGTTYSGFELPLWFSSLCLSCIVIAIHHQMPDLVSSDEISLLMLAKQKAFDLLKNKMQQNSN